MFKIGDIVWYENKYWEVCDLSHMIQAFNFKDMISICSLHIESNEVEITLVQAKKLKKISKSEYMTMKILDS